MNTINMVGKPCPLPVVEAKKALEKPDVKEVAIIVDNDISVQNLRKMAGGLGYSSSYTEGEGVFTVTISAAGNLKKTATVTQPESITTANENSTTYVLTADQLGISAAEPGQKLMKMFLNTLPNLDDAPENIILLNTAVRLAADDSESLDDLKILEGKGTRILSCGACVQYYELTGKIAAGEVSNMLEIARIISLAKKAVTM